MSVKLDIFSDPVCPWCYIGKACLERAIQKVPDHPFVIEWHPFQLNPDMPMQGVDRRRYLEAKFGGRLNAVKIYARVMEAAEAAGVVIDFDKMPRMPNTLNAHRLIHWAGLEGRQTVVKTALFEAYFENGQDIGDLQTLTEIGAGIGIDRAHLVRLFASDADLADIRARDAHARSRGVTAVPTFILGGQYALQGAQPPNVWATVIADISKQSSKVMH